MPHQTTLITPIAGGLELACACGVIASRLRIPPLVGDLLAGIASLRGRGVAPASTGRRKIEQLSL